MLKPKRTGMFNAGKTELIGQLDNPDIPREVKKFIRKTYDLSQTEEYAIREALGMTARKSTEEISEQIRRIIKKREGSRGKISIQTELSTFGNLTPQEQKILKTLFLFYGRIVPHEVLYQITRGTGKSDSGKRIVDTLIWNIQQKTGKHFLYNIENVRGRGYKLVEKDKETEVQE